MSTRPASPPPVARWPFFVGDVLVLAIAWIAVSRGDTPPGLGAIVIAFICVLLGVALAITPFLLDYDARLRMAEAAMRETNETQARRLAATAEQLAHAVSRSQSTEEQAGQALGTLEEMAEKLASHAEELAQSLTRAAEGERAQQKGEIERLTRERDDALAALDNRVGSVAAALAEAQAAAKKSAAANGKALDEIRHRLDALAARFESLAAGAAASAERATRAGVAEPAAPVEPAPAAAKSEPAAAAVATAVIPPLAPASVAEIPASAKETPPPAEAAGPKEKSVAVVPVVAEPAAVPAPAREKERERVKSPDDNGAAAAPAPAPAPRTMARAAPKAAHPELPLEGMPEPRPPVRHSRRDGAGVTSLVATAYIGIGNKLFLRGEGPGLSWDEGVPMQFLAIGKWGWTTTEATAVVTCRVYRNDDTPMLDENIVIAPGAKTEIAPRF